MLHFAWEPQNSSLFVMVCNRNNLKTISGSLGLTLWPRVEAWEAYLSLLSL